MYKSCICVVFSLEMRLSAISDDCFDIMEAIGLTQVVKYNTLL